MIVKKNMYIFICVEHLTTWPIARTTRTFKAVEIVIFVNEEIITPFGPPKIIVSDNAGCFTLETFSSFEKTWKVQWKIVLTYAPMSNGKA